LPWMRAPLGRGLRLRDSRVTFFCTSAAVRRGGLVVLALTASLLSTTPGFAQEEGLRRRVEARLAKAGLEKNADIQVEVKDGSVILTGAAPTVDALRAAERAARRESRVVDNRLTVVPAEPRSDSEIRKAVGDVILLYPNLTVFDNVELGVEKGVVVLQGSVREPYRGSDIENRVARVPGVREIKNEIAVQPVSFFDDRLRAGLYRSIYGDELFVRYAQQANPPIHIIVDRGHVTLTGYVGSAVEQAVLGSIARQSLAFSVDNQVKVDGEAEGEANGRAAPTGS
jgi:hyperosmotically inducible protein